MSTTHLIAGTDLLAFEHRDESVQGARHNTNEDSHGVHLLHGRSEPDPSGMVFAVADGATGRPGGARASQIAIQAVGRACRDADPLELGTERAREMFLRRVFEEAQQAIEREALRERELESMATTLSIALVIGPHIAVGCVGDSPAWVWHGQALEALETGGQPGAPGAMLGVENGRPAPVLSHRMLTPGDQVVLATDGLAEVAGPDELVRVCRLEDVGKAVEQLARRAKEGQAQDDVTLMLVRFAHREPRPHALAPSPPAVRDAKPRYASIDRRRAARERTPERDRRAAARGWRLDPSSLVPAALVLLLVAAIVAFIVLRPRGPAASPPPDVSALLMGQTGEVFAVDPSAGLWIVAARDAAPPASLAPFTSPWVNVQFPARQLSARLEFSAAESLYFARDRRQAYRITADPQRRWLYVTEVSR